MLRYYAARARAHVTSANGNCEQRNFFLQTCDIYRFARNVGAIHTYLFNNKLRFRDKAKGKRTVGTIEEKSESPLTKLFSFADTSHSIETQSRWKRPSSFTRTTWCNVSSLLGFENIFPQIYRGRCVIAWSRDSSRVARKEFLSLACITLQ